MNPQLSVFLAGLAASPLAPWADKPAWAWTQHSVTIVRELLLRCPPEYRHADDVAVHPSAVVEFGANIKGPAIIGPDCFVASTALVRGGCWLDRFVIIGPSAELKSSFVFAGSKLAHLNFVGDSVIGADVNIEAGAMIANYRNERADKRIRIKLDNDVIDTGVDKFGALCGDHVRIGANSVIAPGAILPPRVIVPRMALLDQS